MNVKEIMTKEAILADALEPIAKAAGRMKEKDVGWLPVISGTEIIGTVTDRDIVIRGIAEGLDVGTAAVRDITTLGPIWCSQEDSLLQAAETMKDKRVRRLLVVDNTRHPVGVVTIGDFATEAENDELLAETLEAISSD